MKQRIITGLGIIALIILAFFSRMLTLYVFDVCVGVIAVFASLELSSLMKKMGYYNFAVIMGLYPTICYLTLMLCLHFELSIYLIFVIQIAVMILLACGLALYSLIAKRRTQAEMKIRESKLPIKTYSIHKAIQTMLGFIYPTFLFEFLIVINRIEEFGYALPNAAGHSGNLAFMLLIFTVLIPIITDTFAYLMGSLIGGKKLCPKISPNKTWAGAVGGVIWTILALLATFFIFSVIPAYASVMASIGLEFWHIIILGLVGSVAAQAGDIFESYLKRKAEMKDSGNLLPGHGGVLDRIDSHIFSIPVTLLFFIFFLV